LLPFLAKSRSKGVDRLRIEDFSPAEVRAFLAYVEQERGCGGATRNLRLATIHSLANDHGGVATTPANERSSQGRQWGEVGQTYGESIPFANVTRDHCPEPRNASLQSAS
jgi:hypothetical protein